MPRRADPRSRERKPQHRDPRLPVDRAWVLRGLLAVVVVALVLLIAKAAMIAFGGATRRDVGIGDGDSRVAPIAASDSGLPVRLQRMPIREC